MSAYLTLFISAVIVNNFVLTRFLGLCIFFGVSKNLDASIGMGMAVTSVITLSSMLAWVVYNFVLVPFNLVFLKTVVFVLLIASFVQLLEIIIKKQAPALYNSIGSGLGFALAIVLMASLREKLRLADVPKPLEGLGVAFILAGMLALSFMGFSGMISL